jgi:hypothetical protein
LRRWLAGSAFGIAGGGGKELPQVWRNSYPTTRRYLSWLTGVIEDPGSHHAHHWLCRAIGWNTS